MKRLTIFLFLMSQLSACSVYKSQGRKQFETDSSGKLQAFSLQSCQKQNAIAAWFQSEFPNKNYEMVVMESDLEVWKSDTSGTVEVKAIQINDDHTRVTCTYHFSSEDMWNNYHDQFIQELENNAMIAE